jgi:predicted  nucleic acid-binding Zn-ribbon protein
MARQSLAAHAARAGNTCANCDAFDGDLSKCNITGKDTTVMATCAAHSKTAATAAVLKIDVTENQALDENETTAAAAVFDEDTPEVMIGMIQMAEAMASFSSAAALMKLQQVKDNKIYGKSKTWEGYCARLGKSHKAVDEQLRNLDALGADAFDKLKQIGATRQDFRRLRKMGDDEQKLLVQEIEANVGDRDSLLELIEELGEKHRKERDALRAELKEADANANRIKKDLDGRLKIKDQRLEAAEKKLDELSGKLNKYEIGLTEDDQAAQLEEAITRITNGLLNGNGTEDTLLNLATLVAKVMSVHDDDSRPAHITEMAQDALIRCAMMLQKCADRWGLLWNPDDLDSGYLEMPLDADESSAGGMFDGMVVHTAEEIAAKVKELN